MRRAFMLCVVVMSCLLLNAQTEKSSARPRVGLVLSGGGAWGAAEVGALKVLEEVGVPIDMIAGTSIGGIVGGLYATGYRAEQLDSMFRSQEWIDLFVNGNLKGYFERITGLRDTIDFYNLPIPFACVAVDIQNQKEVVLRSGSLPAAMRATMAIPGVFSAVRINGRTLVDGGMMNVLPADVVKEMGADVVIAIDLQQKDHETRHFSLKNVLGIGGILDWAVSRPDWKKYNENRKMCDIYIRPDLSGYSVVDFNKTDITAMIALGEDAARAKLKELRQLVSP
ncbi:MAG: patatin-like phospholipase family protein [Prevotella sp.]|nr:patatin-like phospholipase family protein [Prevotella sp.]